MSSIVEEPFLPTFVKEMSVNEYSVNKKSTQNRKSQISKRPKKPDGLCQKASDSQQNARLRNVKGNALKQPNGNDKQNKFEKREHAKNVTSSQNEEARCRINFRNESSHLVLLNNSSFQYEASQNATLFPDTDIVQLFTKANDLQGNEEAEFKKVLKSDIVPCFMEILETRTRGFPKIRTENEEETSLCWRIGFNKDEESHFLKITCGNRRAWPIPHRKISDAEIIDYETYKSIFLEGKKERSHWWNWENCIISTPDQMRKKKSEKLEPVEQKAPSNESVGKPILSHTKVPEDDLYKDVSEVYWYLPSPENIFPGFEFVSLGYPIVLSKRRPSDDAILIYWDYDPDEQVDFDEMMSDFERQKVIMYRPGDDGSSEYDSE